MIFSEKNKAKLEANVKAVLESAEQALAIENAEEQQELTSEEMARRTDRILEKMDEEGISDKYGFQSDEICADSGYGSEQNYAHMESIGVTPYVKYNMFHAEDKRNRKNNPKG
ncbi:MAG: hypothetical protein ACI3Z0_10925 [Candidatus Cryptobacteroides sp.]